MTRWPWVDLGFLWWLALFSNRPCLCFFILVFFYYQANFYTFFHSRISTASSSWGGFSNNFNRQSSQWTAMSCSSTGNAVDESRSDRQFRFSRLSQSLIFRYFPSFLATTYVCMLLDSLPLLFGVRVESLPSWRKTKKIWYLQRSSHIRMPKPKPASEEANFCFGSELAQISPEWRHHR